MTFESASESGRLASRGEILCRAAELTAQGQSFALATVIRRTAPSSAQLGLKALITADGTLEGWLGGACIEPTVRGEGLQALQTGKPRLVVFTSSSGVNRSQPADTANRAETIPEASRSERGRPQATHESPPTIVYPMTCHSGGTVEVYVEPQLPPPVLALFGDSPVNRALAEMAPAAGYAVRVVEPTAELEPSSGELVAVVATMGEWDEEAVTQALDAGAGYVGLVASPRRAAKVRQSLEARLGPQALARLVSPAGLDLGAVESGEIAVTILAQIIQQRRGSAGLDDAVLGTGEPDADPAAPKVDEGETDPASPVTAVDPVCGMEVEVRNALQSYEHAGTLYYFCCSRCRRRFSRSPHHWVAA